MELYDRDMEQAVLAACVLSGDAVWTAASILNEDHFYYPEHASIFKAIVYNAQNNVENDMAALIHRLEKEDKQVAANYSLLGSLFSISASASNVKHHSKNVLDLANRRWFTDRLKGEIAEVSDKSNDLKERSAAFLDDVVALNQETHVDSIQVETAIEGALDHFDTMSKAGGGLLGVDTGFPEINERTGGLAKGDLYILAARPSIGKTAMALSITREALKRNNRVALFSLEMDRIQVAQRMLSIESSVPLTHIRTGHTSKGERLSQSDIVAISEGSKALVNYDFIINDSPSLTPFTLRGEIRRLFRQKPLDLVVVDYLQLMSGERSEDEYRRISEASRQLKLLAREFGVPILALSQLNRDCESRSDKRPQLSDLRSSGSIEQDADVVMLLHRPPHYGIEQVNGVDIASDYSELLLVKQRNGPTGTVPLYWIGATAEFQTL